MVRMVRSLADRTFQLCVVPSRGKCTGPGDGKQGTRPHARSFTGLTDFAERAAAPSPGSCCCGVGRANAMPIAQQGREATTIENKFRDPTRSMKTIFDDCQENTKKGLPYA